MNAVMPVIRSSFSSTCCTESAITSVSAIPLPSGRNISTANWSRSAYGNRRIFSVGAMIVDSRMTAIPPPIVIQGWAKVQSNTLSYVRCTHLVMAFPSVLTLSGLMIRVSKNGITLTASITIPSTRLNFVLFISFVLSQPFPASVSCRTKRKSQTSPP